MRLNTDLSKLTLSLELTSLNRLTACLIPPRKLAETPQGVLVQLREWLSLVDYSQA
jgi:hypothetical protein